MDCNRIMNNCAEKIENGRVAEPYTDENGVKRCPVCNEPVEFMLPNICGKFGGVRPRKCRCQTEKEEAEEARLAAVERERKAAELRKRVFAHPKEYESTFDKADDLQELHIKIARWYVDTWEERKALGAGLFISGNTETGKTFTALCIANALVDKLVEVRYIKSSCFVSEIVSNSTTDKNACIEEYASCDLLIIDDFGAEYRSEYSMHYIGQLIDTCYSYGTPLVITSNITVNELHTPPNTQLQRIYSRIAEVATPVSITGDSRRKAKSEKLLEINRKSLKEWIKMQGR